MSNHQPTIPVILSGGSGTRLWPASRSRQPKQLLSLAGDHSMIRATIDRAGSIPNSGDPIVVTNVAHAGATSREIRSAGITGATLILEPMGRNTAPAIAAAALQAAALHDDPILLVLPADHLITDQATFADAVGTAVEVASGGFLVTFGITPRSPETGYGYIRAGDSVSGPVLQIVEFKEKPDAITAEQYVASGDFSWNSGMFVFKASTFLEELERYAPDILGACRSALESASVDGQMITLGEPAFSKCRGESVDIAVMEQTSFGAVLPVEPGWSAVGSWSSLAEVSQGDGDGNTFMGDVVPIDTTNSYVRASDRLVATIGLDRIVVVETSDAVLVSSMDTTQDVKRVADRLVAEDRPEVETNGDSVASWGVKKRQSGGTGHSVHVLEVDANEQIPLHDHDIQDIHWQVTSGVGEMSIGDDVLDARPGVSVYIPANTAHGVRNKGEELLRIVQITVDKTYDSTTTNESETTKGADT
ncbi:MAG: mannose-1-phosphate guanylyltransferase/mannose-6-phosphate isomerase [Acidimicrobiia bacterium]